MNTVLLLILLVPIIEIYLFIKIGSQIGAFNTISLIFITAIIGIYYAKYEGLKTLKSGFTQLSKNEPLGYEILSGAGIAFAALLLIIPGFLTDIIGFLLIFPFTRKLILNNKSNFNKNTDLLLYLAARSENMDNLKKNFRKKIILLDRFTDSTIAYQHFGMGLDFKIISKINKYIIGEFKPNL